MIEEFNENPQEKLVVRVLREVSELTPDDLKEVEKGDLPQILFHGFDYTEARDIVLNKAVNPDRSLRWFSRSFKRAALAYGFSIPDDVIKAQRAKGIIKPDGGFTDEYHAERIKNDCRLVIVLFPKIINARWVVAKNQPTVFNDSDEFITDSTISLSDVVVTTTGKLRSVSEIDTIASRDELLNVLGISENSQSEMWQKIKEHLEE